MTQGQKRLGQFLHGVKPQRMLLNGHSQMKSLAYITVGFHKISINAAADVVECCERDGN